MPGLEFGFVECANGSLASEEYDCVLALAESWDRTEPFGSACGILVAVAKVASKEDGCVKV